MHNEYSIRVVDVSKRFGAVAAVDHVSLDIRRGEFFSLLGAQRVREDDAVAHDRGAGTGRQREHHH